MLLISEGFFRKPRTRGNSNTTSLLILSVLQLTASEKPPVNKTKMQFWFCRNRLIYHKSF